MTVFIPTLNGSRFIVTKEAHKRLLTKKKKAGTLNLFVPPAYLIAAYCKMKLEIFANLSRTTNC